MWLEHLLRAIAVAISGELFEPRPWVPRPCVSETQVLSCPAFITDSVVEPRTEALERPVGSNFPEFLPESIVQVLHGRPPDRAQLPPRPAWCDVQTIPILVFRGVFLVWAGVSL